MGSFSIFHWIVVLIVLSPVYLAPTIVASVRKHDQLPILVVINVLLGWTGIGWLIALVWAAVGMKAPAAR